MREYGFPFHFFLGCIETGRSLTVQSGAAGRQAVTYIWYVTTSQPVPHPASSGSVVGWKWIEQRSWHSAVCWVRAVNINKDKALGVKGGWQIKQI